MIIFDIETGPLDKETVLSRTKKFVPPKHPGEFDESTVKTGNYGTEKAKEKIQAARLKHVSSLTDYEHDCIAAREQWEFDAMDKAALCPTTGKVLAIGYRTQDKVTCEIETENEFSLLVSFWSRYEKACDRGDKLVGHNIFGFDLPFLIHRSRMLGVPVSQSVIRDDRYWNSSVFVCTQKRWTFGSNVEFIKLDFLSQLLGGKGKPEGVDGSMFADLINGTEEQFDQAVDYLKNDLEMTWHVALALDIV